MDERYVYGACCTWHGSIHEVKTVGGPVTVNGREFKAEIPGCPHCGGPLMEYKNRKEWDDQTEKFMAAHPDMPLYREWLATFHGPCIPMREGWDWRAAYAEFAGKVQ